MAQRDGGRRSGLTMVAGWVAASLQRTMLKTCTRFLTVISIAFISFSCGSEDKHLPSSNPSEYDPKKVYAPPVSPRVSSAQGARVLDNPLAAGTVAPDPCEKQPKKLPKPDEPSIVSIGEAGRDREPVAGGGSGGGSGGGEGPAGPSAKYPSYVLEFRSMIVSTRKIEPAQSQASAVIPLVASGERSPGGQMKYIWQGMVTYKIAPLPNRNACDPLITGEGTVRANGSQAGSAKIELLHGIIGMSQETSTGPHFMLNFKCTLNPPEPIYFGLPCMSLGAAKQATIPRKCFL